MNIVIRSLPFPRNEKFIGRDSELRRLEESLLSSTNHQRTAVYGLGGCGKSAIAIEFAYRTLERSPEHSVFWVPAINKESIELAYREIGNLLRIPGVTEEKVNVRTLVNKALSAETRHNWLMIIDNADDDEVLFQSSDLNPLQPQIIDHLPYSAKGAILFTTRNRKLASKLAAANTLELMDMSENDAEQLLVQRLAKKITESDKPSMKKLLELLTNLPLAIVQAAAFMNKNVS